MLPGRPRGRLVRSPRLQRGASLLDGRPDAFVGQPEHRRVAVAYQPVCEDHPRAFTVGSASSWSARSRISDRALMISSSLSAPGP